MVIPECSDADLDDPRVLERAAEAVFTDADPVDLALSRKGYQRSLGANALADYDIPQKLTKDADPLKGEEALPPLVELKRA